MGRRGEGQTWRLYVDETGAFDGEDTSAVVGLLLRSANHHELDRALRAQLSTLVPEVPWPLHANALVYATQLVIACKDLPDDRCARSPVASSIDAAWRWMQQSTYPEVQSLVELSSKSRRIDHDRHVEATTALRHVLPEETACLRARLDAIASSLKQTLLGLRKTLGEDSVFVVAAVSSQSQPSVDPHADRYLDTLRGLFERTFALLRQRPRRRESVRALVARRHVATERIGRHTLHVTDVQLAARAARGTFPDGESPDKPCESTFLNPELPVDYRANPEAGLVLVDFLAHRLRRVLRAQCADWTQLATQMEQITGLRPLAAPQIEPGAGPIPTIALPDPWRVRLTDIAAGRQGSAVPPSPRWAREATAAMENWVGALR
ncbi:MAG: hypothetical protein Q8Q09_22225 [Deltaproteobacteria bacterium]|nr:hypothetical protein [Deltaproteobacteria bacterium]